MCTCWADGAGVFGCCATAIPCQTRALLAADSSRRCNLAHGARLRHCHAPGLAVCAGPAGCAKGACRHAITRRRNSGHPCASRCAHAHQHSSVFVTPLLSPRTWLAVQVAVARAPGSHRAQPALARLRNHAVPWQAPAGSVCGRARVCMCHGVRSRLLGAGARAAPHADLHTGRCRCRSSLGHCGEAADCRADLAHSVPASLGIGALHARCRHVRCTHSRAWRCCNALGSGV